MTSGPTLSPVRPPASGTTAGVVVLRLAYLLLLLFGFLVAIETMSKAIKALGDVGMLGGGGENEELFGGISNPFAGLALGVLFTVLVQSSSTTTATIVAVVGSGALSVQHAVPMILGANIGTTITNTLVSIGHVRHTRDFRRAFAAATVHDFFNLMMVAAMLPVELATGFLSRSAGWLSGALGGSGGAEYKSPLKTSIKALHTWLQEAVGGLGFGGKGLAIALLVVGVLLTFLCLHQITRNMRRLMAGKIEGAITRTLDSSGWIGVAIGMLITVAVQSSSITTSLLVPMCAAGVMRLRNAFPIMLGANIGTTVTALLASLAQDNPDALTIAFVHLLFNVLGVVICMSVPPVRRLPVFLARELAKRAAGSKVWVVGYVLGVFVLAPLIGWFVWRTAG